jgi:hypothetical protein
VKVNFTLEQATKAQRCSSVLSLASSVDVRGWSTPRFGRFVSEKDPVPIIGGNWVGPGAGLDGRGKTRPPPAFDPWTVQAVASRSTD